MKCKVCGKPTECSGSESLGQGLYRKTYHCTACGSTLIQLEKSSSRLKRERLEEAEV